MLSKFVNQTTQLLLWLWSNKETCKYSFFVCCCFVCFGCGIYTICTINSPPLGFPVAVVLLCLRPQVQSLTQCKILPFGLALASRTFTKCMDAALAPLRFQGNRVLNYLDDWLILAHSRESVKGCPSLPHSCSWPQNEHQEECSLPFSMNCVFGSSLGFHSNAGLSGSCLDFQPQYMFGPLQARPSCLREHLLQALRAHGHSLPCAAPGVAPHEAVPLVDEHFWGLLHRTSHSPSKGVAKLCVVREPIYNSGSCFSTLLT